MKQQKLMAHSKLRFNLFFQDITYFYENDVNAGTHLSIIPDQVYSAKAHTMKESLTDSGSLIRSTAPTVGIPMEE